MSFSFQRVRIVEGDFHQLRSDSRHHLSKLQVRVQNKPRYGEETSSTNSCLPPFQIFHPYRSQPTAIPRNSSTMKTPPGFPTRHPSATDVNSPPAYETRPSSPQSNQPNGDIEMLSIAAANTPADTLRHKFPVLSSLVERDVEAQTPTPKAKKDEKVKKVKEPKVGKVKTDRRRAQEKRFKEVATPILFVSWLALWITLVAWGAPKDGGWGKKGKTMVVWAVVSGSLIAAVPVLFSIFMCLGNYIRHGVGEMEE